jgi:pilus assembly protein CpaF
VQMLYKCCDTIEKKLDGFSDSKDDETGIGTYADFKQRTKLGITKNIDMGAIQSLIDDESINDILVNGPKRIFVEKQGILQQTDITFNDDMEVFEVAENIVKAIGRKIDHKRPLMDARLLDGSRVNIIAPPLAVDGTTISIRKFSKKDITLDVMRERDNLSLQLAEFLKVVGKCRLNVVISGGTGSGKTTLLNAISQHINQDERIVTIEDAAELRLQQPHVVRLETKPHHPGMKLEDSVSIRDLVKNALRMRPDRIIVGEIRGPEAFDMMQAMNSGHEGSLTTIHANHPRDALSRLENMVSMADLQIPMKSLRYQMAAALHVIVQISRMRDGQRRITFVSEVVGMEGDMITMHDLFTYKIDGEDANGKIQGKFKWSGIVPRFVKRVEYYGETERLEASLGVKFPKAMLANKG